MNWRIGKIGRVFLVVCGSVLLTTFTIDATDTLRTSQTALGIMAKKVIEATCPNDMVLVDSGDYQFCIDKYEAGVGEDCVIAKPSSAKDTAANASDSDCEPISEAGVVPWTTVAKNQAEALCAKAGKRLPTAKEWYKGALGTADNPQVCNIAEGAVSDTGRWADCRSGAGAFDMVGNVWELVNEEVIDSQYGSGQIPTEGYVSGIDDSGVAFKTSAEPDVIYNEDYFWSESFGRYVVMRGGFFGSRKDGGVYAVHAKTEPSFASGAVGFRCALTL